MATRDGDEELALFLEMRKHDEKEQGVSSPLSGSNDANKSTWSSPVSKTLSSVQPRRTAVERFLYSENEKSDYDWLLTPPDAPQFEKESEKSSMNVQAPKVRPAALNPRQGNIQDEPVPKTNIASKLQNQPPRLKSCAAVVERTTASVKLKPASIPKDQATKPATTKPSTSTKSTARSSTPISTKPSLQASKRISRSATPTLKPSSSSDKSAPAASALARSSSVTRSASTLRSKPSKPAEKSGFLVEAPPNLRISLPERPVSAPRGRETLNLSAVKLSTSERAKRQSKTGDDVNPVLMGTKVVERVVNMRKLAPPKQDGHNSAASLLDGSGFGRTLSKSSLDMALRHMDIRRSISGNLRITMNKQNIG